MLASSSSPLVVVSALAIASLSVSSCGGHTSPCCCHTGASVVLPPSAVAPIASVSTDGSCGASDGGGEPGARYVNVSRHSGGTCAVQVVLADGDTYAFTVEFAVTSKNVVCDMPIVPVDASVPVLADAGPCHASGDAAAGADGAAGTGGETGADGGIFSPACAGLTTAIGVAPTKACGCTASDPQLCYKPCGPEDRGARSETCMGGFYAEMPICAYDPSKDYSCYKVPFDAPDPICPRSGSDIFDPPHEASACTVADCVVCNSYGGLPGGTYIDRGGVTQPGYCVCSLPDAAGNRSWSCAGLDDWPCPNGSGCN